MPTWLAVLIPILAALVSGIAGIAGALLGGPAATRTAERTAALAGQDEQRRWNRERQEKAYVALLDRRNQLVEIKRAWAEGDPARLGGTTTDMHEHARLGRCAADVVARQLGTIDSEHAIDSERPTWPRSSTATCATGKDQALKAKPRGKCSFGYDPAELAALCTAVNPYHLMWHVPAVITAWPGQPAVQEFADNLIHDPTPITSGIPDTIPAAMLRTYCDRIDELSRRILDKTLNLLAARRPGRGQRRRKA